MTVFALWSPPRARSTAFLRSMAERGDMTVLHEPFYNLSKLGATDVDGRAFRSRASLLAWLRDETQDRRVFLGATMAAYCAAVGLPFIPRALAWEPGFTRSGWT